MNLDELERRAKRAKENMDTVAGCSTLTFAPGTADAVLAIIARVRALENVELEAKRLRDLISLSSYQFPDGIYERADVLDIALAESAKAKEGAK